MTSYLYLTGPEDYYEQLAIRLAENGEATPSIWIGKRPVTDFARDRFPECITFEVSEVVSDPTPPRALNEEEFRILSEYWSSQDFLQYRVNLAEEFNRYLTLDSLTMMERDSLIRNIQAIVVQALCDKRPDFVLSLHPPHNPLSLAAWHLCEWLEIPSLYFSGTSIYAPVLLPKTSISERLTYRHPLSRHTDPKEFRGRQAIRSMAERIVGELQTGDTTDWEKFQQARLKETSKSRFHRINDFRQDVGRLLERLRNPALATMSDYLESRYRALVDAHAALPDKVEVDSFGYFALHYQPEATSVPMGLEDTYHGESVRKARAMLPIEIPLLVKEHPSQISWSEGGFRGRTGRFYSFVNSLPNTIMISAHTPNDKLLSRARVVFTLNGTVGLEAAMRGIPVVHFGLTWWEGMPGTRPYGPVDSTFDEWLPTSPQIEDVLAFLEKLAREGGIPHYADTRSPEAWGLSLGDVEEIAEGFVDQCAEAISVFLEKEVHENNPPRY